MNHTPTIEAHAIFVCPSCGWRAVLANDGRLIQTVAGESGHDHIGQALKQREALYAHVEQVFHRLRRHYADGDECGGRRLSLAQLQRLYHKVRTEYGL